MTCEDIEITVPNGIISNAKVINKSGGTQPRMRLRIALQCAYVAHLDQVQELLIKIAADQDHVCAHPTPRVRVHGFDESGIELQLLCCVDQPEDRGGVTHLLYTDFHN